MWKEKSVAQTTPFEVHLFPSLDAGEAGHIWDDLEYKEYSYNEPAKDLPLKVFEAVYNNVDRFVVYRLRMLLMSGSPSFWEEDRDDQR